MVCNFYFYYLCLYPPGPSLQVHEKVLRYFVLDCHSLDRSITLGVLYGYKMVLQIIALIIAFTIRKVKIKGLNDTKYIAVAVYITSIITAMTIVITFTLDQHINIFGSIFGIGFFIVTTVILGLVMLPPVSQLNILCICLQFL